MVQVGKSHDRKRKRPAAEGETPPQAKRSISDVQVETTRRVETKERLAKRKKNHTLMQGVVTKWETVRRHDVALDQQAQLVKEIYEQVAGHVAEISMSHTGSRVVQAVVKLGTPEQKEGLIQEVLPNLLPLAKSPYGHFLLVRLIAKASPKTVAGLVKALQGHVPSLLRHPCGASVIAELYSVANGKQRNLLTSEFYGKEFVVFGEGAAPATLADLLKDRDARTARAVIQRMSIALIPIMEKGMLDPPIVHRVVAEYLSAAPVSAVRDAVELLAGPALLRCVHTHSGAVIACTTLAYGTAKDRKKAVKAMKGHVKAMAQDQWGHCVLMAAILHVDDTQLLSKIIIAELQAMLEEACSHKYARHILLQLLSPGVSRYLPPHLHGLLHPSRLAMPDTGGEGTKATSAEGAEGVLGGSKKALGVKMRELLEGGRPSFGEALAMCCAQHASALLRAPPATDLLVEVARGGDAGVLVTVSPEGVSAVHDAVLAEAAREPVAPADGSGEATPSRHVLEDYYGSRGLRRLVLASRGEGPDAAAAKNLATQLWSRAFKGNCANWLDTHARKVLAALWDVSSAGQQQEVEAEVGPLLHEPLDVWAERCLQAGLVKS